MRHPSQKKQQIQRALLQRLPEAARYLLPNGQSRAGRFYVGDVHNTAGESLVIELTGDKAGLWHDFATGDGGDIFDLWGRVRQIDCQRDFKTLLRDIDAFLGTQSQPVPQPPKHRSALGRPTAQWDYTDANGEFLARVFRYDPPTGRKQYRPWDAKTQQYRAPSPRPLYNLPQLVSAEHVILVEGEKCAQTLIDAGYVATTAMNGAKAPIAKTDWTPLADKIVTIWPDHDEAGLTYAQKAASAIAKAGARSVAILDIPKTKPPKWDAADAIDEGLDIQAFLQDCAKSETKPDKESSERSPLSFYSFAHLRQDKRPMPPDLIAPRVLTSAGIMVFGGAPKVGKSDFLMTMLAHMATGQPFMGMAPPRPLQIFYLQAEIQYHYLRERIHAIKLPSVVRDTVSRNFILTSQISFPLCDKGLAQIKTAIKQAFPDQPPDIIAIDPLRNLFDGGGMGGENDNDAMMFFLTRRVEALRRMVNPEAGIILAHHTRKMPKKALLEDPFQALSGAGSLRSYYSSGLLLHRPDEQKPERELLFELRNGPELSPKILKRDDKGWHETASSRPSETSSYNQNLAPAVQASSSVPDIITRFIRLEARQNRVYTANQFAERFAYRSGLSGARSIRGYLNRMVSDGQLSFFKDGHIYGLPTPRRSRQGTLCVPNMTLQDGQPIPFPTDSSPMSEALL